MMDIRKIYSYALQREHEGKRFFEQNAERLSHAAAVGAFKALAAEEQKHIEFIQSQINALDQGQSPSDAMGVELEKAGFFSQRAHSELLDQTVLEAMVPDLPVLRMAYLIERDFAEFYEMAATQSQGEAQKVLKRLAEWERSHEMLFKQLHDKSFEEYAQMPWGG
jgi:rubrerythrin